MVLGMIQAPKTAANRCNIERICTRREHLLNSESKAYAGLNPHCTTLNLATFHAVTIASGFNAVAYSSDMGHSHGHMSQ